MMLTDEKTAICTPREFADLPEYSGSIPTGTTIGKRWKRDTSFVPRMRGRPEPPRWYLGEYVPHADAGFVGIVWRELLVVDDSARPTATPEAGG